MEDILIISNYYPPEKGAAANRIEQLAHKLAGHSYRVSVICPLGNYPEGCLFAEYRGKFSVTENRDGISVNRLWIYPSNSKNVAKRLLSILSFSSVLWLRLMFGRLPKKVIIQSPPLLLSFLSVLALSIRGRKIILNVSDLWPTAALELGVMHQGSFSHKIALFFERFIYRKATLVLGQSQEILAHVKTVVPNKPNFLYRNFPDHEKPLQSNASGPTIRIFYAGLMGVAQGILDSCRHIVLPENVELHLFGDGAEKQAVTELLKRHPEKKIFFHGMIPRKELHERLSGFDIAYVPLATRIYGSVPSKIFEYAALGLPILYFGGGEGEDIVRENRLGWVAPVGDFSELNSVLETIGNMPREALEDLKIQVLQTSQSTFDLERQLVTLIGQNVF